MNPVQILDIVLAILIAVTTQLQGPAKHEHAPTRPSRYEQPADPTDRLFTQDECEKKRPCKQ